MIGRTSPYEIRQNRGWRPRTDIYFFTMYGEKEARSRLDRWLARRTTVTDSCSKHNSGSFLRLQRPRHTYCDISSSNKYSCDGSYIRRSGTINELLRRSQQDYYLTHRNTWT